MSIMVTFHLPRNKTHAAHTEGFTESGPMEQVPEVGDTVRFGPTGTVFRVHHIEWTPWRTPDMDVPGAYVVLR